MDQRSVDGVARGLRSEAQHLRHEAYSGEGAAAWRPEHQCPEEHHFPEYDDATQAFGAPPRMVPPDAVPAYFDYQDAATDPDALKPRAAKMVNVAGAVMSLALIAGLGVWGYRITVRDVTGVPVVQALEGPMRVAPDDPGGEVATYTGLSVNQIAEEGEALGLPDEITLAPGAARLTEEDLPLAAMVQSVDDTASEELLTADSEAADGELVSTELEVSVNLPDDVDPNDPVAVALAMADRMARGAEPLSAQVVNADPEEPVDPAAAKLAKLPGVKRSLRPIKRPAGLRATAQPALASDGVLAPTPASLDVAQAGAVAPGTRLVQLGAFETPDEAASLWTRLNGQFDSLMLEKSQLIMEAESGGKTFYRLRAQGFADLSDARRFCAALVAEKAECIPVVAR